MDKKGQVTIFIVIAIIAAVIIILAFALKPKIMLSQESTSYQNIQFNIEECLNEKLKYEIVSIDFVTQPSLLTAEDYLKKFMKNSTIECSQSTFSQFGDSAISYDYNMITSTISFLNEDEAASVDINDIVKIKAEVYFPITIKQKINEETISKFNAEEML